MTPVVTLLAVMAYFTVLTGVSAAAARGGGTGNSMFFTGERRVPWLLVAIAALGAPISGVTFISVPGMVAAKGYSYLQMVMGFIVGYALIAYVLVPVFYRRNLVSIYGYLSERFGALSHRSGAWIFFISKMLGAAVRFLVVCTVLQTLLFGPLGLPFALNVAAAVAMVWLMTRRGGVKSVIWTDVVKSACLVLSVVMCIFCVASGLGLDASGMVRRVADDPTSRIFYFDDPRSALYFWKQFLAGVFMAIAMNGLDQDMMQRNLSCRDSASARKNMIVSSILQFFVIALFLVLGTLLVIYVKATPSLEMPAKSDELFGLVAAHGSMPLAVGLLFVVGLVAAAYNAAASALTSLTTSFTVDILCRADDARTRRRVHMAMAVTMGAVIVIFYHLSSQDAISAVYTLASYTYGPILGLFAFGLISRRRVIDAAVPWICVAAPVLSAALQWALKATAGYQTGFELLLINALLTVAGLATMSRRNTEKVSTHQENHA